MSQSVRIVAPAKLNLGLAIRGKREDGFHDLVSVFQAISWADVLTFQPAEAITLTCDRNDLSTGSDNLVRRAAELVREHFGVTAGAAIHLEKNIPWGAGLGGGSSDAAATFRGLAELWDIDADDDTWMDLHAQIGSDVPFFHHGGTAVVTGRGEKVEPLTPSGDTELTLVVAVPPVHIDTGWAFKRLATMYSGHYPDASAYEESVAQLRDGALSLAEFVAGLDQWNTFQPVVEDEHPVVRQTRRKLARAGASVTLMSGSGSAVFGMFSSHDSAERALRSLPEDVAAQMVTTVSQS